jgi:hypothetical protein
MKGRHRRRRMRERPMPDQHLTFVIPDFMTPAGRILDRPFDLTVAFHFGRMATLKRPIQVSKRELMVPQYSFLTAAWSWLVV